MNVKELVFFLSFPLIIYRLTRSTMFIRNMYETLDLWSFVSVFIKRYKHFTLFLKITFIRYIHLIIHPVSRANSKSFSF